MIRGTLYCSSVCCCGAQLLMITLARSVTLVAITAPRDAGDVAPAAWGAVISDGEIATGFGLPFLLGMAELDEINALRAALSGTVRRSMAHRRINSRTSRMIGDTCKSGRRQSSR